MRVGLALLSVVIAAIGCASRPAPSSLTLQREPRLASYEEAPATALAFDPPLIDGEKPIELTRDEREPTAFVGFDGPITTSMFVYTDDYQDVGGVNRRGGAAGGRSRFQRDAQIEQTGVSTR